jgi:hypothetical protein
MVDPTAKTLASLDWFSEMQSFMDWLDVKVKAGTFEVMSFEKMLGLYGYGPLIGTQATQTGK